MAGAPPRRHPSMSTSCTARQEAAAKLARAIVDELGWNAVVPTLGERVRLDLTLPGSRRRQPPRRASAAILFAASRAATL